MSSVYVIKSLRTGKRYVGKTSKKVSERIIEHNQGKSPFTRNNRPFILIYYENNYCNQCVGSREKFLKSGKGRKLLDLIEAEKGF